MTHSLSRGLKREAPSCIAHAADATPDFGSVKSPSEIPGGWSSVAPNTRKSNNSEAQESRTLPWSILCGHKNGTSSERPRCFLNLILVPRVLVVACGFSHVRGDWPQWGENTKYHEISSMPQSQRQTARRRSLEHSKRH